MLDFFFNPQSVAVIGASNNESKGGYDIIKNVMAGFRGKIYPVNKSYTEILGIPCYPDVASIPGISTLSYISYRPKRCRKR